MPDRNQDILDRLVSQLKAKGMDPSRAYATAVSTLQRSGSLDTHGKLTAKGRKRSAMGADGRAKERAARGTGHDVSDFVFNPKTNTASLKRGIK